MSNDAASQIQQAPVTSAQITDGQIVNADISASAAIAGSKLQAVVIGSNAGVVPSTGLPGRTSGAVPAGTIGEYVSTTIPDLLLTASFQDLASLVVPSSGLWLISVQLAVSRALLIFPNPASPALESSEEFTLTSSDGATTYSGSLHKTQHEWAGNYGFNHKFSYYASVTGSTTFKVRGRRPSLADVLVASAFSYTNFSALRVG